jgi:hypothetical protein
MQPASASADLLSEIGDALLNSAIAQRGAMATLSLATTTLSAPFATIVADRDVEAGQGCLVDMACQPSPQGVPAGSEFDTPSKQFQRRDTGSIGEGNDT